MIFFRRRARTADLLNDDIFSVLLRMALPLMGISFIQMAYQFADTMWLGRLSTYAVAAVGSCTFFLWIANAVALIGKVGLSVGLAQAYGEGNKTREKEVMASGFQVQLACALLIAGIYFVFGGKLLSYYQLPQSVYFQGRTYLYIVSAGMVFTFMNPLLSATFITRGNSATPFKIGTICLIANILADPVLIYGFGPIPPMGTAGAALATIGAQALGTGLFFLVGKKQRTVYYRTSLFREGTKDARREILALGIPACGQSSIHAMVGMILNRSIASFGAEPVAVYAIGAQIEAISWMSAEGFSMALSAFMGQNFGAGKFHRLREGYGAGMKILGGIGLFATALLYFGNRNLFALFVPQDPLTMTLGGDYLQIMAFCQFFMAVEIGTAGAYNGLGLTRYPAWIGGIFNILRIPMAYFFMPIYGVNGIWISMSLSGILTGVFALGIFELVARKTDGFRHHMERLTGKHKREAI